jgi:molybdopterin/thiamine biosynthesis adenylyltransferase
MNITEQAPAAANSTASWSYETAFVRNLGLINPSEQQKLRQCRVAIVGMGGVGGIHLVTLARLGIGRFTIADPDIFEVANFNRQYGANVSTVGRLKTEVMAEIARAINPEVEIRSFTDPIGTHNAAAFLQGADLFVDGIDFFAIDVRRFLFRQAASQGIYAITAGPIGFSTAWLVFSPLGMSFDRYFDLADGMEQVDKVAAFLAGVVPKATHRAYLDMSYVDYHAHVGPSASLACHLAAGVMATEAIKILLQRGPLRVAPRYQQFDPYRGRFVRGRLIGGNRHPLQQIKRWLIRKKLKQAD